MPVELDYLFYLFETLNKFLYVSSDILFQINMFQHDDTLLHCHVLYLLGIMNAAGQKTEMLKLKSAN